VGEAPVSLSRNGQVMPLFQGNNVQGLYNDGEHLYAIEDRKGDGRLMRYDWRSGQLDVLRSGLTETEGLTRCNDGRLLYTEKASGKVRALSDDGQDPVVVEGLRNPTFLLCDARGLWISEDSTHRARLLRVDGDGSRHTVLSFLKAPQRSCRTARVATCSPKALATAAAADRLRCRNLRSRVCTPPIARLRCATSNNDCGSALCGCCGSCSSSSLNPAISSAFNQLAKVRKYHGIGCQSPLSPANDSSRQPSW
jgi:hypothetical protein